jgi:putative ABC transport system permease protein
MVANLSYLDSMTHDPGPNVLFVRGNGDPTRLAARVAAATASYGTNVTDIRRQASAIASSITAVDLHGIARIEEAFVLALAAATMAIYVAVALAERRKELATMSALGASLRRSSAFLWSEAALVLAFSLAFAAVLGWLLAEMLVAMLQHVFDPPPHHLAVPLAFLLGLGGAATAGGLIASLLAAQQIRRLPLGGILREQ